MKCIKCGSENQQGSFCSNCGTKLKEKCAECGQMELIGRVVCETKLQKAEKLRWDYIAKKTRQTWKLFLYSSLILLITILGLLSAVLLTKSILEVTEVVLLYFLIIAFIFIKIIKFEYRSEERAKKKFFKLNPKYAEIIKKAEGGKK